MSPSTCAIVAVLGEVGQSKLGGLLLVICANQTFAVTTGPVTETSSSFHTHPCLNLRNHIGAHSVIATSARDHLEPIGIAAGQVEEIHARKGHEKPAEQRKCVDNIGGVETFEEDKGGA